MNIEWKNCFKIGVSIFLLYLCIHYWEGIVGVALAMLSATTPLLLGGVIAYLVNILMSIYEKYYFPKSKKNVVIKSRRPVCMVGAFATLITIVLLLIRLVLPQFISCVQLIFAELPGFIEVIINEIEDMHILPENIMDSLSSENWREQIGQVFQLLTSGIGNVMDVILRTISSVFSVAVTALMSVIFSIYLLLGKDKLKAQFNRVMRHYLRKSWCDNIDYLLDTLNRCFRRYIVGQCTEAVIIGCLCTLGMLLLGLPYATMIGALIGFTALIPVAGAYIGALVGAFMIFMVSPIEAVIFLVFIVVLQQLEDNLIYPRVVGSSLGLPGIWVIAAVTIGGGVMGVVGMILSVPLTATLYTIIRDDINKA